MTFPDKGTLIPFGEAQKAIECITDAYNKAIEEHIEDEALRNRLHAAVAGNVFEVMMSRIQQDLKGHRPGDPAVGTQQELSNDSEDLFKRLFGG